MSTTLSELAAARPECLPSGAQDSLELLEILPILVWRSGRDARCDYFNQAWLEFTGRRLDQELGDGWAEGVHPEDRERCVKEYREAFEARSPFALEYRLRHRDGAYRWIRDLGRPRCSAEGEFSGYIGGCIDITESKAADQRIRESETRLRAFMNNSPSAMFIKDLEGRYLDVNRRFLRLFGLDRDAVVCRRDAEVFDSDLADQLRAMDAQALYTGAPVEAEEDVGSADDLRTHLVCKFPIVDAEGSIAALGGIRTDITERKRAEREICDSREQLRALASRLSAVREEERVSIALNLHDELGQVLTVAKLDLSLLESAFESRKKRLSKAGVLRELRSVECTLDRALDAIRRIVSELRPAVLNELGLAAAVEWLAQDFEKRARVRCSVALSKPFPEPDKQRSIALYRILQEALTNVARHARAKSIEIELGEHAGSYVMRVRDDGIGVPDERLRDWRSHGLSGMRERVLMFDGRLAIERGTDGCTTVTVSIPRGAGTTEAG